MRSELQKAIATLERRKDYLSECLKETINPWEEANKKEIGALDTALAALRDALKRSEGCYACREEQPYCDDSGWWAMYEGDTLRLSANGQEHRIASPFCINCGRALAKEGGE